MEKTSQSDRRWFGETVIAAVSTGFFFVLIGIIFVINQNLWTKIIDYLKDFTTVQIAHTSINVPVPATPAAHTAVYSATFQFALGIAILQILILAMRVILGSRIRRTAETTGNLVFWFGAAYKLNNLSGMESTLTHNQQLTVWFQFWAVIIILIGLSLVSRAAVLIAARYLHKPKSS